MISSAALGAARNAARGSCSAPPVIVVVRGSVALSSVALSGGAESCAPESVARDQCVQVPVGVGGLKGFRTRRRNAPRRRHARAEVSSVGAASASARGGAHVRRGGGASALPRGPPFFSRTDAALDGVHAHHRDGQRAVARLQLPADDLHGGFVLHAIHARTRALPA
jgi:hypothetical protein